MNIKKGSLISAAHNYFFLIFIAFLFTLLVVAQVSAETAWVKWEHETATMKNGQKNLDNWYLQEAFPTYGACMSAVRATVRDSCNGVLGIGAKKCTEEDTFISASYENEYHLIEFYCYPDTIDPRKK
jgi:hypothetical protein